MSKLVFLVILCVARVSGADNPKCAGSPDRYDGSKQGCPDARHPKESKFKPEPKQDEKPAPPPPPRDPMPKVLVL